MGFILIQGIQSDPINFYETIYWRLCDLELWNRVESKDLGSHRCRGKWSISQRAVKRGKERALEDEVGRTLERPAATGPKERTTLPCLPRGKGE